MWYIKFIAVILVAALVGFALLLAWPAMSERAQGAPVLQQGTQVATPRHMLLMPEPNRRMGGLRPAACPVEDSDPSGQWCVWTNPRTGKSFYVSPVDHVN